MGNSMLFVQMVKLRRWMTEILLDVTTEMMEEVSAEVVNRARMKGILQVTLVPCCSSVVILGGGEQSLTWHCFIYCSFHSSLLVNNVSISKEKTKRESQIHALAG